MTSDSQERATAVAQLLMQARTDRTKIDAFPAEIAPRDLAEAYAAQAAYRELLSAGPGGRQIGWKIGCTNESAQAHVGIDEPFYGGIFRDTTQTSPARFDADRFSMRTIECEIAFRMADDLPSAAAPYDPGSVGDAVDAVLPAIEIVDNSFTDWTTAGAVALVASNGSHGAWVHGAPVGDWQGIDLSELEVILRVNGEQVRDGSGFNVMEHPINALTWLANVRAVYAGEGLRAGDMISTGTMTLVYPAKAGDRLEADFGPLGTVELEFA